jgi:hypothetical protein
MPGSPRRKPPGPARRGGYALRAGSARSCRGIGEDFRAAGRAPPRTAVTGTGIDEDFRAAGRARPQPRVTGTGIDAGAARPGSDGAGVTRDAAPVPAL